MKRWRGLILLALLVCLWLGHATQAQDADQARVRDVIYGKKEGVALTMDVFKPAQPNGIGVLWMVSGGWVSRHASINPSMAKYFTDRGQTVFQVVHGTRPRFTLEEIQGDIHRATRFIRAKAKEYGVEPQRLGISGGSSGGHLALMQGVGGDDGDEKAKDPIDQLSSRVQAVACFFPPTDLLNWGEPGQAVFLLDLFKPFAPGTGFNDDLQHNKALARKVSPITHVSKQTPPIFIIHGDADKLVPIYQAEIFVARLKETGVKHKLVVRPGKGHGWIGIQQDLKLFAEWFEEQLPKKQPVEGDRVSAT